MKRCSKIPSLFDLHADIPTKIYKAEKSAVSFSSLFERQIQTAAFFIPENSSDPYALYRDMMWVFREKNIIPVNDLSKRQTLLLSLEGGGAFEMDIDRLYEIKSDGIRSVMLTWNGDNSLAGGALGKEELTAKGKAAIGLLNRLSLALDISHLNPKSAKAAADTADFLLASHSNSRTVFDHPRNLDDDLLRIIGEKNGLVGLNFYPEFLGRGNVFERIVSHIEYMLSLGLEDNIAVGSDFDGADMDLALSKTEDVFTLYSYLSRYFNDKKLIDKIFFQNAYDFYEKLFDKRT